jgi:hypothetical protein
MAVYRSWDMPYKYWYQQGGIEIAIIGGKNGF